MGMSDGENMNLEKLEIVRLNLMLDELSATSGGASTRERLMDLLSRYVDGKPLPTKEQLVYSIKVGNNINTGKQ